MATKSLTRAEIDELARKLFGYLLEDDEQWLVRLRLHDQDERDTLQERLRRYDVDGRHELLRLNDLGTAADLVDQLLEKEKVSLTKGSNEYWLLCQLALRAYAEAGRQKLAKFDGNYALEIEDALFTSSPPSTHLVASAPAESASTERPPLSGPG